MKRKIITFHEEAHCDLCFEELPEDIRKRVKKHKKVPCLIVEEDDYLSIRRRLQGKKIVSIEDDAQVKLHASQRIPWGVSRVKAPSVWRYVTGRHVRTAVLDTGICREHPDLRDRVHGGVSFVDDDPYRDDHGHGTHVAGTIAATFNRTGVVGVAPHVSLYAVKTFTADGNGAVSDIIEGIAWCLEEGIDVMNMSFGLQDSHAGLKYAVETAKKNGMIIIASVGNDGGPVDYPAAYADVLAVGAMDRRYRIPHFSCRGPEVDLVAPGVNVWSTWPAGKGYKRLSGTSMAAPHVTGMVSLILSRYREASPEQVKRLLLISAVRLPGIDERVQGKGFVTMSGVRRSLAKRFKRAG